MLFIIVGFLFLAGSLSNFFSTGDMPEAFAGLAIACMLFIVYFVRNFQKKKSDEFLEWVKDNKVDIHCGRGFYKGMKISPDTEVVQFEVCMSFLIMSFRIPTCFYIKGHHNTTIRGGLYSLISLVFGWWGIPWGPIYTVKALMRNASGGNSFTVRSLIPNSNSNRIFED